MDCTLKSLSQHQYKKKVSPLIVATTEPSKMMDCIESRIWGYTFYLRATTYWLFPNGIFWVVKAFDVYYLRSDKSIFCRTFLIGKAPLCIVNFTKWSKNQKISNRQLKIVAEKKLHRSIIFTLFWNELLIFELPFAQSLPFEKSKFLNQLTNISPEMNNDPSER